jgi:NADH dehydrogenase
MILATGATGFIGRSLSIRLNQQGREWRPYKGRISNPITLRPQLAGVDTVIHLAGAEARGRNRPLNHVDVESTGRLLEECRRAEVQRFIFVSRIGADANSSHALLRAKGEAEHLVRKGDIPFTILRPATLFGRHDRFTELIVTLAIWNWPFVWLPGGGMIPMQPLWVEDFTRCLVATLDRPDLTGATVTLAGEERLHYHEILQLLLETAGYSRLPVKVPLVLLHPLSALLFGWWWRPPVTRYFIDRFFVPEVAEIDSVLQSFGFRPARLRDAVAYLHRPGLRWRLFVR